ncbi:ribosome silencing factor [Lacticaseibacillus nasuensis]|uniref:Ribosomal silencing factor RsfS n=1 Tax=Lacticaseibacillus nasuensis JCM 17158 TaxID=1291734 RepID=A0A0R1JKB5_9LACO|nr:ribosome silencing factor [Lacticaseibacillus nasuensis]KRK71872.1 Iojap family protein [Lacticaseibacillus nasuensis JCM 17158]
MTPKELLELIVRAGDDKRASDIVALDMAGVSLLADYFVIMSGSSERQVQAIVKAIDDKAAEAHAKAPRIEGKKGSKWLLMDFGDVVVHVFVPEEREFYNLEKLWSDAPLVDVSDWVTTE